MVQLDDQRSAAGATFTRLTPIESSSIAGLAYEQIRALILSGEMAPGARLSQLELAERLAISRTPVREALRRLAGEGLVDALPQIGRASCREGGRRWRDA